MSERVIVALILIALLVILSAGGIALQLYQSPRQKAKRANRAYWRKEREDTARREAAKLGEEASE